MEKDNTFRKQEPGSNRYLLFQIVFFGGAVLINFILPRTAGVLRLPLYLDNVGTLMAAILGGYLPGIFVGYLNNIINTQSHFANSYTNDAYIAQQMIEFNQNNGIL